MFSIIIIVAAAAAAADALTAKESVNENHKITTSSNH
jgi:hypothetical protein